MTHYHVTTVLISEPCQQYNC